MIAGTETENRSDAETTKDTPYLALTGDLLDVFCEYLWENWPRYNGTALYMDFDNLITLAPPTPVIWKYASNNPLSEVYRRQTVMSQKRNDIFSLISTILSEDALALCHQVQRQSSSV